MLDGSPAVGFNQMKRYQQVDYSLRVPVEVSALVVSANEVDTDGAGKRTLALRHRHQPGGVNPGAVFARPDDTLFKRTPNRIGRRRGG